MRYRWLVAGPLLLIVLALGAAIVLIIWSSTNTAFWFDNDLIELGRSEAASDEVQTATVSGPARLVVESRAAGQITIASGASDTSLVIAARKATRGANPEEAAARLAALRVVVTSQGNEVTVRVESAPERVARGRVDFQITVPVATSITAKTHSGAVTVSGTTGTADLYTALGPIRVTGVQGGVTARTASGAVTLRAVRAGAADLTARSDFGEVSLIDVVAGEVVAHSSSGRVEVADATASGPLTATSSFGSLEITRGRAASLTARTASGQARLAELAIGGPAVARSSFGDVTLTAVQAATYDVSTANGTVILDGASGALRAKSDFGDVRVTNARMAQLDVSTSNGSLAFSGSLRDGSHRLKSDFGDIRLQLPNDAALTVDLRTDFGGIRSSIPITGQGTPSATHWRGTVNGGGASLTAITSNGSISLAGLTP